MRQHSSITWRASESGGRLNSPHWLSMSSSTLTASFGDGPLGDAYRVEEVGEAAQLRVKAMSEPTKGVLEPEHLVGPDEIRRPDP